MATLGGPGCLHRLHDQIPQHQPCIVLVKTKVFCVKSLVTKLRQTTHTANFLKGHPLLLMLGLG